MMLFLKAAMKKLSQIFHPNRVSEDSEHMHQPGEEERARLDRHVQTQRSRLHQLEIEAGVRSPHNGDVH